MAALPATLATASSSDWEAHAKALCDNRKSPVQGRASVSLSLPSILSVATSSFSMQLIEDLIKDTPTFLSERQLVVIDKCNKDIKGDHLVRLTRILIVALAILPILMPLAIDPSSSTGLLVSTILAIGTGLVFFELGEKKSDIAQEALRRKEKVYNSLCTDFNQSASDFLYSYVQATPLKEVTLTTEELAILTNGADVRIVRSHLKGQSAKFKLKAQQLHEKFPKIEKILKDLDFTEMQIGEVLKPLKCAITIINPELPSPANVSSFYLNSLKLVYRAMRRDRRTDLLEELRTRQQAPGTTFTVDVD